MKSGPDDLLVRVIRKSVEVIVIFVAGVMFLIAMIAIFFFLLWMAAEI